MPRPKAKPKTANQYEALGKALVNIYESGYLDIRQSYKQSFIKGMLAGLGGVIGATIVVGLLIWSLTLLNHVPLVKRASQNIQQSLQEK